MKIERYSPEKHSIDLELLFKFRELTPAMPAKFGFGVYDLDNRPIAFGFLRMCEGDYALFDGIITNPHMNGEIRDKALDLLTKTLLMNAKSLNIKCIIGWSIDINTLKRAEKHGFSYLKETLIYKVVD